jgi:predicted glycosyl hydrolase (DUF1957 family)
MQSSDWAFMVSRDLAGDYPRERMDHHGRELDRALHALHGGAPVVEPAVRSLAPDLDLSALTTP